MTVVSFSGTNIKVKQSNFTVLYCFALFVVVSIYIAVPFQLPSKNVYVNSLVETVL